ncbi:hypothetical protein HPB49_005182 [Dermacentor silvarum]|uniref:Uncharacterized protein n=1 Tax=Dermacentor silvarum TaxID=543639 RepID=A0ACB8DUL2_DERSI|nr:hypothetical protein HPB49_005182 [Dermacentor silvarum]
MDQGIIKTTWKLYRKALLQRMLTAYDTSKRYNIDLLGVIHLLNFSLKELHLRSILYDAVHKIAGQEVEGNFETFALADAAAPVVAPATDAEIIDSVGDPNEDEELVDEEPREVPTLVQTREYLRLLRNKVECMGGDHGLVQCLVKLEQGLLASGKNLKQPKLTAFLAPE